MAENTGKGGGEKASPPHKAVPSSASGSKKEPKQLSQSKSSSSGEHKSQMVGTGRDSYKTTPQAGRAPGTDQRASASEKPLPQKAGTSASEKPLPQKAGATGSSAASAKTDRTAAGAAVNTARDLKNGRPIDEVGRHGLKAGAHAVSPALGHGTEAGLKVNDGIQAQADKTKAGYVGSRVLMSHNKKARDEAKYALGKGKGTKDQQKEAAAEKKKKKAAAAGGGAGAGVGSGSTAAEAVSARGAGGFSEGLAGLGGRSREADQDGGSQKKGSLVKKTAAVGAVGAGGAGVAVAAAAAALAAFLKTLFMQMLAAVAGWFMRMFAKIAAMIPAQVWSIAFGAIAAAKAVKGGFMALGGFISNATGGLVSAGAATVATGTTAATAGLVATSMVITGLVPNRDDDAMVASNPCTVGGSGSAIAASDAQISANTEDNAKLVFSVLSTMGMSDENIAGILGNWSQESGIDPTSVESIFSEPFTIGPEKKKAESGGFTHIPGQEHGGIGLGQWSNGRTPMLIDFAKEKGEPWYTIETQLAFMAEGDNPSDVAVVKDMIENSQGSPEKAAVYFHDKWERSADSAQMMGERQSDAKMWMGKMSSWEVDPDAAKSARKLTSGMVGMGDKAASTANLNCDPEATAAGSLREGGSASEEDAKIITDLYNKEGDEVLTQEFGGGGPGKCNGSYIQNCTSFSWYFITKYTTYDRGYAPGNGVDTADSVAGKLGKKTTKSPTPYSVFSNNVGSAAGHTGVVLGVEGDNIIIGEASYCQFPGRVRTVPASEWKAQGWEFLDMSDMIDPNSGIKKESDKKSDDEKKTSGSLA